MGTAPQIIAGRYELTALVSSGGMGQVWRGYDIVLDRDIAVKLIKPEIAQSPDRVEFLGRFRREARVTAKIEHPGVPAVFDAAFDEAADRLYIVMQLVHGMSLADLYHEYHGPLPIDWAVSVAAQICSVLSYAHAVPAVHRDLKPENVMVDPAGMVKVLDFGVAAVLRSDVTRLTSTGRVLGTRPYMSPEQIKSAPVSPRSDLYALGCVLHELVAGRRVFDAVEEIALMYQHLSQPPTPLRELRPEVSPELERLVLDLLAKEPADRPATAWDVHDRLLPMLPAPDFGGPDLAVPPGAMPDPTRPYRRPAAPRPRAATDASTADAASSVPGLEAQRFQSPVPMDDGTLRDAHDRAVALLDADRFSQAAEVLADVIDPASAERGPDNPKVLELRLTHAAALFLGGDFRRALPELDGLAAVFARVAGPTDERAIDCRKQAAYCHAELGDFEQARREVEGLQPQVAARFGDLSEEALAGRLDIARFEAAAGRDDEAGTALRALHGDAVRALGLAHPVTEEVRDMLARIRFQDGYGG